MLDNANQRADPADTEGERSERLRFDVVQMIDSLAVAFECYRLNIERASR
jgi:hypothetical protein